MTKLDDNLMPRAEALQDFTARDSQQLSFKVRDCLCLLQASVECYIYTGLLCDITNPLCGY